MKREHKLKRHTVTIVDEGEAQYIVTELGPNVVVDALPIVEPEHIARARSLGYTGTDKQAVWQMTREHDLLHVLLAEALDTMSIALKLASDRLRSDRTGSTHTEITEAAHQEVWREEETVLFLQRLLNKQRSNPLFLVDELHWE